MDFEKLSDDFIKTLELKHYPKTDFYDNLMGFLEAKSILCSEEDENILESMAYQKARVLGYVGYKTVLELDDLTKFKEKMDGFIKKQNYILFHISHEPADENDLSFTDIWKKWKGLPPEGWIAGWCSCGHFFPYTFDIASMDMEAEKLIEVGGYKPIKIEVSEIEKVLFCTDSYFRLILKDGECFKVKTYVSSKNMAIDFADDRVEMFKGILESW